ncbi:MAG: thiolase family protein [Planctomycetota bacterium]
MPEAVIVAGIRTPFVKAAGPLRHTPAQELGRTVTRELLYRLNLKPDSVDELIAGNVATPADAANVGRVIALYAGIPEDRIGHSVSRNCASGFECVTQALDRIRLGEAKTVMAVGVESMSNIPLIWTKDLTERFLKLMQAKSAFGKAKVLAGVRGSHLKPVIGVQQGLTDPVCGLMMGDTADKIAREFGITRKEQDEFALRSHLKATEAWDAGRLAEETMCVYAHPNMDPIAQDIGPRKQQTFEALNKMRPYFDPKYGTITVGNACQITDGAVALLLMEEETAKAQGFKPLGRIRSYAYAGCDPARMGLGPVYATAKALDKAKMTLKDMEQVEINEAFAAQVLGCLRGYESKKFAEEKLNRTAPLGSVDMDKLNVNGGAIALGHPVGATGTRLVLTLLKQMQRSGKGVGLATLCIGGGQGGAVIVERSVN